jgi:predicted phosphodiesterase
MLRIPGTIAIVKRSTCSVILFLVFSVWLYEAYTMVEGNGAGHAVLPANFGNFDRVRTFLPNGAQGDTFSFAVIGDTQGGHETFEQIVEELRQERLAFVVLLGDIVSRGTKGEHNFLRSELEHEFHAPCPIFYVVGNHDVNRSGFPLSEFERTYGPANASFGYQGCLFVLLRVTMESDENEETIAFLASTLAAQRTQYRKVLVFMHVPPPVSPDFPAKAFPRSGQFIELFNRFQVDYVVAGDYHGYARTQVDKTVYLISGGGGAHLEKESFGKFHHSLVITVGPDSISERILFKEGERNFEDSIEGYAVADLYPWLQTNMLLALLLNLVACGVGFLAMKGLGCLRTHSPRI